MDKNGISILKGFFENIDIVLNFYEIAYSKPNKRRIVLCGFNPGRFGAGKTGVPFFDYLSLSQILPYVKNNDSERSAKFIWSIISKIGQNKFFENVYLTNISWFGFTVKEKNKNGNIYTKNINYFKLEEEIKGEIFNEFLKEMDIINPSVIFPLGDEVSNDINILNNKHKKNWKINNSLKHPNYCSFPKNIEEWQKKYIEEINIEINKSKTSA